MQASTRPTRLAWLAFAGMVLFGGANIVFVKISNEELAPFWGAFLRFFYASLLFFAFVFVRRVPLPRGRALTGAIVYGLTSFGLTYALAYSVLKEIPAGLLAILFGAGPLVTMLLASMHRLERLRLRGVLGAIIAMAGISLVVADQISLRVSPMYLGLAAVTLFVMAESSVLVKYFPRSHPAGMNAVAMLIGSVFLLALSFATSETHALPTSMRTLLAVGYLILLGSIGLFGLFLYALARMDVSVISYQFVFMPLVTLVLASVLVDEPIRWTFLAGGLIVGLGVFWGLHRPAPLQGPRLTAPVEPAPQSAESATGAPRP